MLFGGFENLNDRSRDIMQRGWLLDPRATLQELADKCGASAERIRQLEAAVLKKLKARFEPWPLLGILLTVYRWILDR